MTQHWWIPGQGRASTRWRRRKRRRAAARSHALQHVQLHLRGPTTSPLAPLCCQPERAHCRGGARRPLPGCGRGCRFRPHSLQPALQLLLLLLLLLQAAVALVLVARITLALFAHITLVLVSRIALVLVAHITLVLVAKGGGRGHEPKLLQRGQHLLLVAQRRLLLDLDLLRCRHRGHTGCAHARTPRLRGICRATGHDTLIATTHILAALAADRGAHTAW